MNNNAIDIEDVATQLACHTKAFRIIADAISREVISQQKSGVNTYGDSLLYYCEALASVQWGLDNVQDALQARAEQDMRKGSAACE